MLYYNATLKCPSGSEIKQYKFDTREQFWYSMEELNKLFSVDAFNRLNDNFKDVMVSCDAFIESKGKSHISMERPEKPVELVSESAVFQYIKQSNINLDNNFLDWVVKVLTPSITNRAMQELIYLKGDKLTRVNKGF